MLLMLLAVALSAFGLTCLGWAKYLGLEMICNADGLYGVAKAFVLAAIANQTAYSLSPRVAVIVRGRG
jgi:hypothetical protein